MHNSLLLNRVTPYGEKIYMTLSAYVEVSRRESQRPEMSLVDHRSDVLPLTKLNEVGQSRALLTYLMV